MQLSSFSSLPVLPRSCPGTTAHDILVSIAADVRYFSRRFRVRMVKRARGFGSQAVEEGGRGVGLDEDLGHLDREALIAEVKRLRAGIRKHRDSSGHDLCWHHPELWGLLPEKSDPMPAVPAWPQFLRGCLRYRESLDRQLPNAPRTHVEHEPEP